MARRLTDFGSSSREDQGIEWLEEDIGRCIERYQKEYRGKITINPTPRQSTRKVAKKKPGRRHSLPKQRLLDYYKEHAVNGRIVANIKDVAKDLGVSETTVKKVEKVLRADGIVSERDMPRDRSYSWIDLLNHGMPEVDLPIIAATEETPQEQELEIQQEECMSNEETRTIEAPIEVEIPDVSTKDGRISLTIRIYIQTGRLDKAKEHIGRLQSLELQDAFLRQIGEPRMTIALAA